jgi:thiol-disulfide isomerase/thioredoxin
MSSRRRASRASKKRPTVVFFYMIGCPHCEVTRPAWNDAKKKMKGAKIEEKESKDVTASDNVSSFPTIVMKEDGKEVKRIDGSRTDADAIVSELGVNGRSSGGRRTYRRSRKLRHRTLRNYKAFA